MELHILCLCHFIAHYALHLHSTGLYVRYSVGEVNGRAVCRMCKVVNVDLHGKSYKLLESGENCTVRLSLLCGGQVSIFRVSCG
jgi:hypothetical protein